MTTSHFAVLTAQKQKGSGGGLSAHIDRQVWNDDLKKVVPYQPQSVTDAERSKLNQELIMRPGMSRSLAIENRIKEAGITRKIKDDAVRALCFICTSDHDKMHDIESRGQLKEWANDCIRWMQKEFGKDNVVAAALHMDETTPHLHVTVVPVVQGQAKERKNRPKLDEDGQPIDKPTRSIRKQQVNARLSAKDIMTPRNMTRWQSEFAQVMERWGMERGIEGSQNQHESPKKHNEKERLMEQALGIIGQDKRSRQFRKAYKELETGYKEEIKAIKLDSARKLKEYKAEMEKTSQIEKNELRKLKEENARTSKELTDIVTRETSHKNTIFKQQEVICSIADALPGAKEAKEVVSKACRHDHEKWETLTMDDINVLTRPLSPIKDELAKNVIIREWFRMAKKWTSSYFTKERYENVLADLRDIVNGTFEPLMAREVHLHRRSEEALQDKREKKIGKGVK